MSNSPAEQEKRFIPLAEPQIGGKEWEYVKECLDTNWVSSVGSYVDRFERELAEYLGTRYAVATSSGTAALHIALLLAGVEPDDEVLVSTLTFIAPANTVRYIGAWPVFIDADPQYWQMDPDKLADFAENFCRWENGSLVNKATGRRVKAVLPVHILGHPCDMESILEFARKWGLTVVEDATESLGATYHGHMVGADGADGDIACFSFNGNKIITAGGGGMITTGNPDWAQRAKHLTTQAKDDPIEYIHSEIGYNYRLTNIQAALGCAQLQRIDEHVASKQRIARNYRETLSEVPGITLMNQAPWANSTFWLYTVLVDQKKYGMDCRSLMKELGASGIQTRPLWQPLHLSKAHEGAYAHNCEVAELLWRDALSIPSSVGLEPDDQSRVTDSIAAHAQAS